ncbi:bifunctional metallophosphatase/5'-nucleotidase, partial [Alteripontixanthobacter muriae]|uniref:bifunctional metallophosphatase/5'-nucleotidase n=1 Tax=Alteripontixanthobacter muriae TaxID=2705546 RepID=UPI001E39B5F5
GEPLLPATGIKRFDTPQGEVAVGVIGLTLKDTPILVTPSGVDGLTFADEAATINAFVPQLEAAGADAILVAIHQGLSTTAGYNDEGCGGIAGALLGILQQVDPRVDLVLSGHTHNAYVCDYGKIDPSRPFLVTSAAYGGSMLTDIALEFRGDRLVAKRAENIVVGHDGDAEAGGFPRFAPDAQVAAYVERYVEAAREAAERPVGRLSGDAVKGAGLGRLIADAQLSATREAGAQIALMNSGGIRAPLASENDGIITFGDIYAVQPFGNVLMTKSLTGAQLFEVLEQQFAGTEDELLSPSAGFAFTYDTSRAPGQRILSATLEGRPIHPAANYRVTMNSFLASGGDGFATFAEGTEAVTGPLDLDAMEAWFAMQPVTPVPAEKRAVAAGSQPR